MRDRVEDIIVRYFGNPAVEVTDETSFIDDLGADSLELTELFIAFEEEFNTDVDDAAIDGIATVGDLIRYLQADSTVR